VEVLNQDIKIKEALLNVAKSVESLATISVEKGDKMSVHIRLFFEFQF